MLQDWTPARASLASGIVIKQHLLERNKYPVPQATPNTPIAYYGSGSGNIAWDTPFTFQNLVVSGAGIRMYEVTGSNAGVFPNLNGQTSSVILPGNYNSTLTQVWSGITPSIEGPVAFTQSSQVEFFNGELSGSNLVVTNGDLNGDNPFLNVNTTILAYTASYYDDTLVPAGNFLNINTSPNNGEIYLLYDGIAIFPSTPSAPSNI